MLASDQGLLLVYEEESREGRKAAESGHLRPPNILIVRVTRLGLGYVGGERLDWIRRFSDRLREEWRYLFRWSSKFSSIQKVDMTAGKL